MYTTWQPLKLPAAIGLFSGATMAGVYLSRVAVATDRMAGVIILSLLAAVVVALTQQTCREGQTRSMESRIPPCSGNSQVTDGWRQRRSTRSHPP